MWFFRDSDILSAILNTWKLLKGDMFALTGNVYGEPIDE